MLTLTSAELNTWIAAFLWPLTRIIGLISASPLFGNNSIPAQSKIVFSVVLAVIISPTVPALPAMDPMSLAGLLIVIQQLIIGLAMGFAMRIVFAAVEMAGEISGMTMGLGFATIFDPLSQGRSSAISQFLSLLVLLIYLASNLHLVLISTLANSFQTIPILATPFSAGGFQQLAFWSGRIFSAGLQLSLPIIAALLITNIALGILTRAAPQLNIFGIGFPITIGVGFIMIVVTLPYMSTPLDNLFQDAINAIGQITTAMLPRMQ
jgi:flagellar biosynthetic protein FliR